MPWEEQMRATGTETLLYTQEYFRDPYPVLEHLRREAPVSYSDEEESWLVTRHADAVKVLRDWHTFSSVDRHDRLLKPVPEAERAGLGAVVRQLRGDMINVDPPDHKRMRSAMAASFSPGALHRLRPRVQAIADELLEEITDRRPIDLMKDVAYQFPARVVAYYIGIPSSDTQAFISWADDWVDLLGSAPTSDRLSAARRANESLEQAAVLVSELLRRRRREPREDILTVLARQEEPVLSEEEVLANCMLLLLAGHETTTSVIGTAVLGLLRNPGDRRLALGDPGVLRTAIEEFLRLESPVQLARRVAREPSTLGGQIIPAGERVQVLLAAANRDPAEFDDPDRCDVRRNPNRHLAFGHGVHFCIGAPLARLEAPILIRSLFERFPDLQIADGEPTWLPNRFARRLAYLPVTLS